MKSYQFALIALAFLAFSFISAVAGSHNWLGIEIWLWFTSVVSLIVAFIVTFLGLISMVE